MCDAEFHYTYEYQGNAAKLVHTPLTDKCYLTLTQGMHMGLGGNPYGPAGTGKTESVKALGGLFGRQVLVFNCDEVCVKYTTKRATINFIGKAEVKNSTQNGCFLWRKFWRIFSKLHSSFWLYCLCMFSSVNP